MVADNFGIDVNSFRLVFNSNLLKNDAILGEIGIEDGSTIKIAGFPTESKPKEKRTPPFDEILGLFGIPMTAVTEAYLRIPEVQQGLQCIAEGVAALGGIDEVIAKAAISPPQYRNSESCKDVDKLMKMGFRDRKKCERMLFVTRGDVDEAARRLRE